VSSSTPTSATSPNGHKLANGTGAGLITGVKYHTDHEPKTQTKKTLSTDILSVSSDDGIPIDIPTFPQFSSNRDLSHGPTLKPIKPKLASRSTSVSSNYNHSKSGSDQSQSSLNEKYGKRDSVVGKGSQATVRLVYYFNKGA
jgi:hypothetical protein